MVWYGYKHVSEITADICENRAIDDKGMKLATMIEHVIMKIFTYRVISDFSPEANGSHFEIDCQNLKKIFKP